MYKVLVGKSEGKRPHLGFRNRRENNPKMYLQDWNGKVCTGLLWLRLETRHGLV